MCIFFSYFLWQKKLLTIRAPRVTGSGPGTDYAGISGYYCTLLSHTRHLQHTTVTKSSPPPRPGNVCLHGTFTRKSPTLTVYLMQKYIHIHTHTHKEKKINSSMMCHCALKSKPTADDNQHISAAEGFSQHRMFKNAVPPPPLPRSHTCQ